MSESELSATIRKHRLILTESGTVRGTWVAYNHDVTGRGPTPDDAVADAVGKIEGRTDSS